MNMSRITAAPFIGFAHFSKRESGIRARRLVQGQGLSRDEV
jgi:hypothetical protein